MEHLQELINQRQDAVVRACFNYCAEWLCNNGYEEAAAKFDKEVLGG